MRNQLFGRRPVHTLPSRQPEAHSTTSGRRLELTRAGVRGKYFWRRGSRPFSGWFSARRLPCVHADLMAAHRERPSRRDGSY
jgi:hypothetical protein